MLAREHDVVIAIYIAEIIMKIIAIDHCSVCAVIPEDHLTVIMNLQVGVISAD
jgi:hypothetical protein